MPVPLFHTFGTVYGILAPLARGACVVLPATFFDAERVLAAVEAERCNLIYSVPTMYIALPIASATARFRAWRASGRLIVITPAALFDERVSAAVVMTRCPWATRPLGSACRPCRRR